VNELEVKTPISWSSKDENGRDGHRRSIRTHWERLHIGSMVSFRSLREWPDVGNGGEDIRACDYVVEAIAASHFTDLVCYSTKGKNALAFVLARNFEERSMRLDNHLRRHWNVELLAESHGSVLIFHTATVGEDAIRDALGVEKLEGLHRVRKWRLLGEDSIDIDCEAEVCVGSLFVTCDSIRHVGQDREKTGQVELAPYFGILMVSLMMMCSLGWNLLFYGCILIVCRRFEMAETCSS